MEGKTSKVSFWIVFVVLIALAAIATLGNLYEYKRMDKLENEGKRVLLAVDSLTDKGSRKQIFVTLRVSGRAYVISKKVKSKVAVGDSVPVYYLVSAPSTHAIATE